jgi:hypothetical protein
MDGFSAELFAEKFVQKYSKVNLLPRKMKTSFTREKAQSNNTYSLVVIRYYTFISPNLKKNSAESQIIINKAMTR